MREDDAASQAMILPDWMEKRADAQIVEIAEEDAQLVALFLALRTQWRWHPMIGQRLGIEYAAIAPTAQLLGIALTPAMMTDLREMENAALDEFARGAKRGRA